MGVINDHRGKIAGGVSGAAVAALMVTFTPGWEGMDLVARHQRIDPPGVITGCIGETNYDDPTLKAGMRFTPQECRARFIRDFPKYDKCVLDNVKVAMPLHRHVAIDDITYNMGCGNLRKSSILKFLNMGKVVDACNAMLRYTRANGKVLQGLLNRRVAERAWCLRED